MIKKNEDFTVWIDAFIFFPSNQNNDIKPKFRCENELHG